MKRYYSLTLVILTATIFNAPIKSQFFEEKPLFEKYANSAINEATLVERQGLKYQVNTSKPFSGKFMGFDDEYFNNGYSSFTLEENLKYFKEFLEGDLIYPSFRIVGLNRKCIHILGCLLDSENNICTVYETVLGHIDMNLRKIIEMDDSFFQSISSLKHSHDNLGSIPFDLRLAVKESV